MIARLRGQLIETSEEDAVVDVQGVGYMVRMGARSLARLPGVGEEVVIHIDTQTREDGTRLYGFLSREDRAVFTLLQAIQGVGPKAALSVLDVLPPAELAQAVAREDKAAVARAQGVGPKLALRIVVELKGKPLGAGLAIGGASTPGAAAPASLQPTLNGEAVAALMGLGLAEPLARRHVEAAAAKLGDSPDLPSLIKAALQESAR